MIDGLQDIVGRDGASLPYESGVDFGSMLLTLAKYAFVTLIVLLVFWAFMRVLRRALEQTGGLRGQGRIRVVDSMRLHGDKLLHIVRVDNKEVLIGSSKENLNYLGELGTVPTEAPQSAGQASGSVGSDGGYGQRLQEALRGIPSLAWRACSALSKPAAGLIARARDAFEQLRRGRHGREDGAMATSEETQILRDGARRVGESTRKFREVLREEVAASTDDSDPEDHGSRLERLRSLAARSDRHDDLV